MDSAYFRAILESEPHREDFSDIIIPRPASVFGKLLDAMRSKQVWEEGEWRKSEEDIRYYEWDSLVKEIPPPAPSGETVVRSWYNNPPLLHLRFNVFHNGAQYSASVTPALVSKSGTVHQRTTGMGANDLLAVMDSCGYELAFFHSTENNPRTDDLPKSYLHCIFKLRK